MGVHQGRAERDHIPVRVLRSEDAAFQTGVDDHHLGLFAELFLIDLLHQVEDGRVEA